MNQFSDFQVGHNCTVIDLSLHKAQEEQHKNMNVSIAPSFLLINSLLEKQLQVCYAMPDSRRVNRIHEFTCEFYA